MLSNLFFYSWGYFVGKNYRKVRHYTRKFIYDLRRKYHV